MVSFTGDCEIVSGIPNGSTLQGKLGINGRFSDKLLLKLALNYGNSTYDGDSLTEGTSLGNQLAGIIDAVSTNVEGLDGLGVSTALSYIVSDNHSFEMGYEKDFTDVYFSNYSIYHQVSARYKVGLGDRILLDTQARYRRDQYSGIVERTDNRITLNTNVQVKLQKRLTLMVGGGWAQLASTPEFFNVEYDDIRVHGGLTFGY